jgi:predicted Zn-dependent protease
MKRTLLLTLCLYATSTSLHAQGQDSTKAKALLWIAVKNVQDLEVRANAAMSGKQTDATIARARPLVQQKETALLVLRARLDSAVFHTTWGPRELTAMRKAYPGSMLFVEYDARLAEREHRDTDALMLYDRILSNGPEDVEMQRREASLLERMGRPQEARIAYARIIEMQPEDSAFRALVRLQTADNSLPDLLARIQRLQLRFPKSTTIAEHSVELLQRMGRTAEAQAAAKALAAMKATLPKVSKETGK